MLDRDNFIIFLFICICILFFMMGYLLGQNRTFNGVFNNDSETRSSKQTKNAIKNNISIDDTKYVVDIKTTGLEKKYENIGEVKESSENITGSINKLKQLKG